MHYYLIRKTLTTSRFKHFCKLFSCPFVVTKCLKYTRYVHIGTKEISHQYRDIALGCFCSTTPLFSRYCSVSCFKMQLTIKQTKDVSISTIIWKEKTEDWLSCVQNRTENERQMMMIPYDTKKRKMFFFCPLIYTDKKPPFQASIVWKNDWMVRVVLSSEYF